MYFGFLTISSEVVNSFLFLLLLIEGFDFQMKARKKILIKISGVVSALIALLTLEGGGQAGDALSRLTANASIAYSVPQILRMTVGHQKFTHKHVLCWLFCQQHVQRH